MTLPLVWVAKTDYAANVGDGDQVEFDGDWQAPTSLDQGDSPRWTWPDLDTFRGVIFGRSQTRFRHIRDGLSKTYLFGEKYIDALRYRTGDDWGDNESLFSGFNNDNCRSASSRPSRDRAGVDRRRSFGSAHASVWQVVYCDGSVRSLSYELDLNVHRRAATRAGAAR